LKCPDWPHQGRTEQGELPAQLAIGLRLLAPDQHAFRSAEIDLSAVVAEDADSFAEAGALRDVAEVNDRAGPEPAGE
jgi:hypothetical protein